MGLSRQACSVRRICIARSQLPSVHPDVAYLAADEGGRSPRAAPGQTAQARGYVVASWKSQDADYEVAEIGEHTGSLDSARPV